MTNTGHPLKVTHATGRQIVFEGPRPTGGDRGVARMTLTVHSATLTENYASGGTVMSVRVLWTDRPSTVCNWCDQPSRQPVERCPVGINPSTGELEAGQDQHGCGRDLVPPWLQVDDGEDERQARVDLLATVERMQNAARSAEYLRMVGELRGLLTRPRRHPGQCHHRI